MVVWTALSLFWMLYFRPASGHSWIACTDYSEENGEYWNANNCRAFPRHGSRYTPRSGQFGADTGYNIINPPDSAPCRTARDDIEAYDRDHPMAVYFSGQEVILAHPAKNHVADVRCTNKYIPDTGDRIWIGPRDAAGDATLTEFKSKLIADLGVAPVGYTVPDDVTTTYPKAGFQNAPKFCENPDKALATNAFTIPDLLPGRYTLMWGWYFNSLQDLYTSCWEADIVSSRSERDLILLSRGHSTADPVDIAKHPIIQTSTTPTTLASKPQFSHANTAPTAPKVAPPDDEISYYTKPGIVGTSSGQCICHCPMTYVSGAKHTACWPLTTFMMCLLPIVYSDVGKFML